MDKIKQYSEFEYLVCSVCKTRKERFLFTESAKKLLDAGRRGFCITCAAKKEPNCGKKKGRLIFKENKTNRAFQDAVARDREQDFHKFLRRIKG